MPTVRFFGKVLPAIANISMDNLPIATWHDELLGLQMVFEIRIINSHVEVQVDLNRFDPSYINAMYTRAFDLVRACIDPISFATGWGLSVYFEHFSNPDGSLGNLMAIDPSLAGICTAFKFPAVTPEERMVFLELLKTLMSEPALFMALNDLILANILPHHSSQNCGRVIDALCRLITPDQEDRGRMWQNFRDTLHIEKSYVEYIMNKSHGPRHGDRTFIPGSVTTEAMIRTWTIMNRFLEFRKRGNQQLSETDFPWLKETSLS